MKLAKKSIRRNKCSVQIVESSRDRTAVSDSHVENR